jgi:predicted dehydrogenase
MTRKVRVAVVGLGGAGIRFLRSCLATHPNGVALELTGGVDTDARRRDAVERGLAVRCYPSVEALACAGTGVDLAYVSVPETEHFGALLELKRCFPTLGRILCEKPLTAELGDALRLREVFKDADVCVNFVERFSPVVERLQSFMTDHRRQVIRVQCFWGKYRIKDPRPTPGVVSVELAHPVDLVVMLAGIPSGQPYRLVSAFGARSDFDIEPRSALPLDTVYAAVEFSRGPQVFVSTSLLWSKRERRIELVLADEHGAARELATLVFDDPIWDLDRLSIFDITASGGSPRRVDQLKLSRDSWPQERFTIGKVCRFLEANLSELAGGERRPLPRLRQAIYVQRLLEDIRSAAQQTAMSTRGFGEPQVHGQNRLDERIDALSRAARGEGVAEEDWIWDSGY